MAIVAFALVFLLGGIVQKNISKFLNYENKISNLIENLYVESISHYLIKDKGWYKNILEFFKKSRKKYVVAATVNSMGKYVSDLVVVIILLLFYVNNFNLIYEIEQNIFSLLIALAIKILTSISTLLGSLISLREGISVKKKFMNTLIKINKFSLFKNDKKYELNGKIFENSFNIIGGPSGVGKSSFLLKLIGCNIRSDGELLIYSKSEKNL